MPSSSRLPFASRRSSAPWRILVVDPDDDARRGYCESLRAAGCDVVEAADGRDALVKAFAHPPALVVTDTRLPVFDGYALCEVLRRDTLTRTVAILVVTAESSPAAQDRARASGADDVLVKPLDRRAVLDAMGRLLAASAEERMKHAAASRRSSADPSAPRHKALVKSYLRFETTTPPADPPVLICPTCGFTLKYESSHIGGVSSRHAEQWDTYTCAMCGAFEYRQRTRRLRRA